MGLAEVEILNLYTQIVNFKFTDWGRLAPMNFECHEAYFASASPVVAVPVVNVVFMYLSVAATRTSLAHEHLGSPACQKDSITMPPRGPQKTTGSHRLRLFLYLSSESGSADLKHSIPFLIVTIWKLNFKNTSMISLHFCMPESTLESNDHQ